MESPGRQALGHILIVMIIASGIGAATAQVNQLDIFKETNWARFTATAVLPIALSALVCIGWHRWLKDTFETGVLTYWILHTFYNPGKDHIELNLPTPETYLVIAATASAGASIALQQEQVQTVTAISATVGGLTSALIASASPRVGAILGKRQLKWQTESAYRQLLEYKKTQELEVLRHQGHRCRDCRGEIKQQEARFTLVNRDETHKGKLDKKHIKAVCKNCALGQSTTRSSKL